MLRFAVLGGLLFVSWPNAVRGQDEVLSQEERARLDKQARDGNIEGMKLLAAGRYAEAASQFERSLEACRRLFPKADFPNGHSNLATSLSMFAMSLRLAGRPDRALPLAEEALSISRALFPTDAYPNGNAHLATCLSNLAPALWSLGKYDRSLAVFEEALAMNRRLYPKEKFPDGHLELSTSVANVGFAYRSLGRYDRALPLLEEAVAMNRRQAPPARIDVVQSPLASSLLNLGLLLTEMGRPDQGLPHMEEALTLYRRYYPKDRFPDGHPELATALNNLGLTRRSLQEPDRALPYFEEALAMYRGLYKKEKFPSGHSHLLAALINLGVTLSDAGSFEQALPLFREALAAARRLYSAEQFPNGHPMLVSALTHLANAWSSLDRDDEAITHHREAMAACRRLYPVSKYPDGHPQLATSLGNVGMALQRLGRLDEALPSIEEALATLRRLYPEARYPHGHPDLIITLNNLGVALMERGQPDEALARHEQALAMCRGLLAGQHLTTSEAEALGMQTPMIATRNGCLSALLHTRDVGARAYGLVWDSKAALTRALEQRRLATRIAVADPTADPKIRETWNDLLVMQRRIGKLQLAAPSAERDKAVLELTDRKQQRERDLLALLPEQARRQERQRLGPDELLTHLPAGAAFVDFLQYMHHEKAADGKGPRGLRLTWRYVAFVLAPGREPVRVELGAAKLIDEAIVAWRRAIDERRNDLSAATEMRRLVWEPLVKHLPAETKTVWLSPDRGLVRLPFAALPGKSERGILLEEYAIGYVPHGPFLAEKLGHPSRYAAGPEPALIVGGVRYDPPASRATKGDWEYLKGTAIEADQVLALATRRGPTLALRDSSADIQELTRELPRARYAHIATHGFFAAGELIAEWKQRLQYFEKLKDYSFRDSQVTERMGGAGARSPLGYVGLVLSGGEVFSGLSIVELPLENLKLVTLSACETGLGDHSTGGEGVQGLQRAFHLAGCPNVVASLWKVNDAATAALMTKFYHEMWVNKKAPIDALREAQLTIYRHPELIPDLAGERGAVRLRDAVAAKLGEPSRVSGRVADTKLWAAFVLSGVGK